MYAGLPPGGLGPRPPQPQQQQHQQHRRGISDISGGQPDMGDAKRQQLYGAPPGHMGQQQQQHGGMHQGGMGRPR